MSDDDEVRIIRGRKVVFERRDVVFAHACRLGLEGIVSKRRDAPYRRGRCRDWLKIKNPAGPSTQRVWDEH